MSTLPTPITRVERSREAAQSAYDRLSRWYDLIAGGSEQKFAKMGLDRLHVQTGEKVLEVGFGTGNSLTALAKLTGGIVHGVDLSTGMARVAQGKLARQGLSHHVQLLCADALHLPYADLSFDAVFLSFVLELFDTPDLPLVLQECSRTLCERGHIGVVSLAKRDRLAVRIYEWFHLRLPTYVDCRPIYARDTLERDGFRVEEADEALMWGLPVEIVIARKK